MTSRGSTTLYSPYKAHINPSVSTTKHQTPNTTSFLLHVPIPRTPDVLGQAEGRTGDDGAGGFVYEELEREGGAVDGFFPGALVG